MSSPPVEAWKLPVGGALAENQVTTADVDGDGHAEAILISAGRVVARHADDTPVWSSSAFGAGRVVGVYNLDGAGTAEVVVVGSSPPGLYVLDAKAGTVVWTAPTTTSAIDALVVPDGNGKQRIYLTRQLGALTAYGFDAGVTSAAQNQLWESATGPWSTDLAAADVDGDGLAEIVRGRDSGVTAYDAATGAARCDAPNLIANVNAPSYFPSFSGVDVDGDGRQEIVVYDYSYYYSEDAGVFVMRCDGVGPTLTPSLVWSQQWVTDVTPGPGNDVNAKQVRYLGDGVQDLDGQGSPEIAYSLWNGIASTWTTSVRNAATGGVIAERTGETLEGIADIDGDGKAEVITRDATGLGQLPTPFFSTLHVYDLEAGALVDKGYAIPGARVASVRRRREAPVTNGAGTMAARQNTDADAASELYVFQKASLASATDPRPGRLLTVRGSDGMTLHTYEFPAAVAGEVSMLTSAMLAASPEAETLLMLADGGLRVLDRDLKEASKLLPGNHSRFVTALSLDGTTNLLFAVSSSDTLLAIDGTKLSNGVPVEAFRRADVVQSESVGYVNAPGLALPVPASPQARFMVRARSNSNFDKTALVAIDGAGKDVWSAECADGRQPAALESYELLDDLDGDGVRDVFLAEADATSTQWMVVRSGATGTILAERPVADLFAPSGVYLQGHAVTDLNGDGVLDVVSSLHGEWIVGIDVSKATSGDPNMAFQSIFRQASGPNGQMVVGALDADPSLDLLRTNSQNSFTEYSLRSLSGVVEASYTPPFPAGVAGSDANTVALVARPNSPGYFDVAWAGMAGDALGAVARLDGSTLTEAWFAYLAGGAAFAKQDMPVNRSALHAPIAFDVDGDGTDEIVTGSDDGWLYALHAGDGSIAFSLQLGAPVIHVIAADVDKDPAVELVAVLDDGTLVALDAVGAYLADDVTPAMTSGAGGSGGSASGTGGSGGATASSASSSASSGSGGAGAGGALPDSTVSGLDASGGGGCHCGIARDADPRGLGWLALAACVGLRRAQRRRRSRR